MHGTLLRDCDPRVDVLGGADVAWAASGHGVGSGAVDTAVAAAVDGLGAAEPGLVLLFPDAGFGTDDVLSQAEAAAPGARLAGMTSVGLVSEKGVGDRGCVAVAFGQAVGVGIGMVRDASLDMRAAGRTAAATALRELPGGARASVLLLFIDPTSGDESAAIDGAYEVAGARIPLAGGGANGAAPGLIADHEMWGDAVVAVALRPPGGVAVGVADGCAPRGGPALTTRTEGSVVLELNGVAAEDVYLEALGYRGAPLDDHAFEALAVLHPLAQPELGGRLRLRHVLGRAPGGGLACATPIPPNAAVGFTEQSVATIVASAERAVRDVVTALPGLRAALVFDCAARKRALGPVLDLEGRAILSALDGVPAVGGLYTRGEVARTRGAKGVRNHAIVVVGLG
jgi:hypothetical protein